MAWRNSRGAADALAGWVTLNAARGRLMGEDSSAECRRGIRQTGKRPGEERHSEGHLHSSTEGEDDVRERGRDPGRRGEEIRSGHFIH